MFLAHLLHVGYGGEVRRSTDAHRECRLHVGLVEAREGASRVCRLELRRAEPPVLYVELELAFENAGQ